MVHAVLHETPEPLAHLRPEVPAELDEAVRLCLERDPGARYRSALEMAEAIEAGAHGHSTDATRRLTLSDAGFHDTDATRALDSTSATRAMPRTSYAPPDYAAPTSPPPRRRDDREARRAARRRSMATFFALLLVLAAIAAVAIAVIASQDSGGGGVSPVNADDVKQQIQELRQLIEENTKR